MNGRERKKRTNRNSKSSRRAWFVVAGCCLSLPYVVSAVNWLLINWVKVPFRIEMTTSEFTAYLGTIGAVLWSVYQFSSEKNERCTRYEREDSRRMHEVLNNAKRQIQPNQNAFHKAVDKQVDVEGADCMQACQGLEQEVRAVDVDEDER